MATLDIKACVEAMQRANAKQEANKVAIQAAAERIASSILVRLPLVLELGGSDRSGLVRVGGCETPPTPELASVIRNSLLESTSVQWIWEGGNIWATDRAALEAAILSKCGSYADAAA